MSLSSRNFKNKQHRQPGLVSPEESKSTGGEGGGLEEDEITEGFLEEVWAEL